ncbi:MAG: TetR family transcriptional regulator [Nitriliruptorales bacterium]|nr:TetR family transcriptional regulator [Nitriliruptorales bacterium]
MHGLRESKKRQTRDALARCALELCVESGVEAVTVAAIADRAGVSRRTFFNYFSSKEEAVLGGDAARAQRLAELLAARPDDEPVWDAVRGAWAQLLADHGEPQRDWLARARLVRSNPSLMGQQRATYAEMETRLVTEVARRTGQDADALSCHVLVAIAVAAVRVAINHWIDVSSDVGLADRVDQALSLVAGAADPTSKPHAPTG